MRLEIEFCDIPTCHLAPELSIYRQTTVAFLRKYFRMSMELGHLPSLLGREFFRTHVTSYSTYTFEDAVIFTHDVDRCLEALPKRLQDTIALLVFQEYTEVEAAERMEVCERTVRRWYCEALDRAADVFVRYGLLAPIPIAETSSKLSSEQMWTKEDEIPDPDEPNSIEPQFTLPPRKPVRSTQGMTAVALESSRSECG